MRKALSISGALVAIALAIGACGTDFTEFQAGKSREAAFPASRQLEAMTNEVDAVLPARFSHDPALARKLEQFGATAKKEAAFFADLGDGYESEQAALQRSLRSYEGDLYDAGVAARGTDPDSWLQARAAIAVDGVELRESIDRLQAALRP